MLNVAVDVIVAAALEESFKAATSWHHVLMEMSPGEAPPCPGDISRSSAPFLQESSV